MGGIRNTHNTVIRASAGRQTNPVDDFLMADSGQLAPGRYEVRAICGGTAATEMDLEHRNAANDANLGVLVPIGAAANSHAEFVLTIDVPIQDQRIRIIMFGAITGRLDATLNLEKLN